jgi:2-dehydropantoate 2-reductase
MRFAILGAGGVGGYYGGLLVRAGHDVRLLARGAHLAAIRERGLEVRTPEGIFLTRPFATDRPGDLGEVEAAFVAVKAYSLPEVAPVAVELARAGATVVPFLNGVDALRELEAGGVPPERLLAGLTYISAARVAPGVVERRSVFQRVRVGGSDTDGPGVAICRALQECGVDAEVSRDIHVELWRKFAFLTAFSAVCGLARADIGTVREARYGRDVLAQAVGEITEVARHSGVALPEGAEDEAVALLESLPEALKPSFLLDLEAGGPNELDTLSGAVCQRGREVGVPTPLHDVATAILGLEGARG